MTSKRREYRRRINSLWVVPMACIAAGAAVAAATLAVDAAVGYDVLPHGVLGTPTAVQTILSTAASAMLTLTTIVLTVMTLGMQLAMQQFSPRIVRALLADRRSQLAHGLFAATFLFCMIAVAKVNDQAKHGGQLPSVTVAVAYVLLFASLLCLVLYVHHAGQSLRVAGLIDLVGDNLQVEIDRLPPVRAADGLGAAGTADAAIVTAPDAGVVVLIEAEGLVEHARRLDDCFEMLAGIGDFVPRDAPILRCCNGAAPDQRAVRRLVLLDNERSHIGDAPYGLRKLVDIAERSIASSPYDDPVTAVQAIDRIHEGLRRLSVRQLPDGRHHDADGVLRLLTRELSWRGYVVLALQELVGLGAPSPVVGRRLLAALDDLLAVAPPDRRSPLADQRHRLLERADAAGIELVADVQGIGAGIDVVAGGETAGGAR